MVYPRYLAIVGLHIGGNQQYCLCSSVFERDWYKCTFRIYFVFDGGCYLNPRAETAGYDENNVFNKIINGELECHKVFENEHVIAILDAYPVVPGHCLLISKLKKRNILDFTEEEAANYLKYLPRLCKIIKGATQSEGINVVSNAEYCAAQRVFHVHFHVVPRFEGDEMYKLYTADYMMTIQKEAQKITLNEAEDMLSRMNKVRKQLRTLHIFTRPLSHFRQKSCENV